MEFCYNHQAIARDEQRTRSGGEPSSLKLFAPVRWFFYYLHMIELDKKTEERFMRMALDEARLAYEEGEVPVGAIVVKDGKVIGKGRNGREKGLDISSHAEINALKEASKALGRWDLSDCSLYVTLEPCLMCAGAILQSRIRYLCFGAPDKKAGAVVSNFYVFDSKEAYTPPLIDKNICKNECEDILKKFFAGKRV